MGSYSNQHPQVTDGWKLGVLRSQYPSSFLLFISYWLDCFPSRDYTALLITASIPGILYQEQGQLCPLWTRKNVKLMLIFKSFLFTVPASIMVGALCGFSMRKSRFLTQSKLFFLSTGSVPFPSPNCPPTALNSDLNQGKGAAMVGREPWGWRLQREDTPW